MGSKNSGRPKDKSDFVLRLHRQKSFRETIQSPIRDLQQIGLYRWFEQYDFRKSRDWFKQLAIWINIGASDFIGRRKQLEELGSQKLNLETSIIKYGKEDGELRYNRWIDQTNARRKNKERFWLDQGFSRDEANQRISDYQTGLAHRGVAAKISKTGSTRHFSPWCKEYWELKGLDDTSAMAAVSRIQTRDMSFFIEKYGELGEKIFSEAKDKRRLTWSNKTEEEIKEHALKAVPHSFNKDGQEMQAIRLFLQENQIPESFCRFGSPTDQFFQWIPGFGYRRYDLAVYKNETRSELDIIFEYHGPGHINFSDYCPDIQDCLITLDGKKLPFLGTYGASFHNDQAKRNHILKTYPGVRYIVMWSDDLKHKRGKIVQLSK